jgi:hypothetical protein
MNIIKTVFSRWKIGLSTATLEDHEAYHTSLVDWVKDSSSTYDITFFNCGQSARSRTTVFLELLASSTSCTGRIGTSVMLPEGCQGGGSLCVLKKIVVNGLFTCSSSAQTRWRCTCTRRSKSAPFS